MTTTNNPHMPGACPHCSGNGNNIFHGGTCPRVKAIEYYPNGQEKRIEFHPVEAHYDCTVSNDVVGEVIGILDEPRCRAGTQPARIRHKLKQSKRKEE